MCGIVGYVGSQKAVPIILEGLKRLEYRGYDSAGLAVYCGNGQLEVRRAKGKLRNLEDAIRLSPVDGTFGIGHTRWATHGGPTEINAHPHCDCSGWFLVAHNGIIENHRELRRKLEAAGHRFRTETDTEVLPHLIEAHFSGNLEEAVLNALREVEGMFAMVAMSACDRMKLVAARRGPPLVVGRGEGENFIASDAAALLPYTRQMLFLGDRELAVVRRDSVDLCGLGGERVSRASQIISWSAEMAEKNGFPHYMLKEIYEQPRAVRDTIAPHIRADGDLALACELPAGIFERAGHVHLLACGTSLHAAHVGKFLFESLAQMPAEADYASEFRYRNARLDANDVVIAISQSGETADTLAAVEEAQRRGGTVISICNVIGSSLARASDGVLYTRAGPEIGVASTKAFTTQLAALYLLALHAGRARGALTSEQTSAQVLQLRALPDKIESVLTCDASMAAWAERMQGYNNFLYLARGACFPIALEGALKLKEISYIHAEGYPAGEMKHGPIALIDQNMGVLVVAPRDVVYSKTLGNIEEVKGRGGIVLSVLTEGDTEASDRVDLATYVPDVDPLLAPLITIVPLQLFAYHMAVRRGANVDKPRNLAKTVTVE
jgi:glucosamine--fructose-6-phosphate aminotransferase (isomerizing)